MISLKSDREIALMGQAGAIIAGIFDKMKFMIEPGIETAELDIMTEEYIRKAGALPSFKGYKGLPGAGDYPSCICASINDEVVHGIPDRTILKEGDIISVDVGVFYEGYHADAARTFPVGVISAAAEKLIRVTEESFFEGIKKAVPGNRISDISAAVQDHVEAGGFSVVRDYVGHGIGKDLHEAPQIPNYRAGERGPRIGEGMTLAVEPMVNSGGYRIRLTDNKWTVKTADGSLSAHYENTIAVTGGKPLILTMKT